MIHTPEIITVDNDKETRGIVYDPALQAAFPTLRESFAASDATYADDRELYLNRITSYLFPIVLNGSGPALMAGIHVDEETVRSSSVLFMDGPYNDPEPRSSAHDAAHYVTLPNPSFSNIQTAAPHSWNQATKGAAVHDVLKAEGHGMPVITLYGPHNNRAFDRTSRKYFSAGNFSPAGAIALRALQYTQQLLHGTSSETQLDTVHFQGSSMGASYAIGAAANLQRFESKYDIKSVTAQELITGVDNLFDLLGKFSIKGSTGAPSEQPPHTVEDMIRDTLMRQELDAHGNELAMFTQIAHALATQIPNFKGLSRPEHIRRDVHQLTSEGTMVTTALADNSAISSNTMEAIDPDNDNFHNVRLAAVNGKTAEHITNENVAATTTATLLGVQRSKN